MITDRNTGECLFYDFTCQKPAKQKQQGCWNQICIVHCRAIYRQSFILLPKSLTISLSLSLSKTTSKTQNTGSFEREWDIKIHQAQNIWPCFLPFLSDEFWNDKLSEAIFWIRHKVPPHSNMFLHFQAWKLFIKSYTIKPHTINISRNQDPFLHWKTRSPSHWKIKLFWAIYLSFL